jgi:hypothetical protein
MMMAEKAADLILGNTPLPAEPLEFYRHRPGAQQQGREAGAGGGEAGVAEPGGRAGSAA